MMDCELLGVYREKRFSPGKVEDDAAILDMTLASLDHQGWRVAGVEPESLSSVTFRPQGVVTMAQSAEALAFLDEWVKQGTRVINSSAAIRNCYRKPLTRLLAEAGVKTPQGRMLRLNGSAAPPDLPWPRPVWLKRGDVHAMQEGDVVFVQGHEELEPALRHFQRHGIEDALLQEHIEGEVIKFYGVCRKSYFKAFWAATGGEATMQVGALQSLAEAAAGAVGIEVYGGDAVLTPAHELFLIDLNDWPSFSRCCSEAAVNIASYVMAEMAARR